ncbi:uncharacterized protein LOC134183463 [Corticium candelabrum]|uniref:uncharacterized protein LOC134183463 n=1 Tax=Corticium candelabrum TaxID=121492 RepID=UPI002E27535B|nr:uncharacterized protein LOC134183463 [Corticium candelabrum]
MISLSALACYACFILIWLPPFTSNSMTVRMHVNSSSDTQGQQAEINEHLDCGRRPDYRCPSLAAAMSEARQIVNSSVTRQFQIEFILLAGSHVINYGTQISDIDIGYHLTIRGEDKYETFLTCRRDGISRSHTITVTGFQYFELSNVTVTGCVTFTADEAVFVLSKGVRLCIWHCDFLNNSGVAVRSLDVRVVNVSSTTFSSYGHGSNISAGMRVLYTDDVHETNTTSNDNLIDNTLFVISCKFMFLTYFESDHGRNVVPGGGLGVWLNDSNNKIHFNMMIKNSTFQSNRANTGGGVYLKIRGRSFSIVIRDSHFNNCAAVPSQRRERGEGGGLAVYLSRRSKGKVEVVNTNFELNSAKTGAAVAIFYADEAWNNNITFTGCNFTSNVAAVAGTVILNSLLRSSSNWPKPVRLKNVNFTENTVSPNGFGGGLVLLEVDVMFEGTCIMMRNNGSAITAWHGSWVIIKGSVMFRENLGHDGAALYLQSQSKLRLSDSANVTFMDNVATRYGGALRIDNADVAALLTLSDQHTRNHLCFITPHHFSLNEETIYYLQGFVTFINNRAAEAGGAIYADTIDSCSWSHDTSVNQPTSTAVLTSSNFMYSNNTRFNISTGVANLTAILANGTQPNKITLPSDFAYCGSSNSEFCVSLGISYLLSVNATDSLGQPVSTTVTVSTEERSSMQIVRHQDELENSKPKKKFTTVTDPFSGIASIEVYFLGDPETNGGQVMIESGISTASVVRASFTVFLHSCIPGFTYKSNTCLCDNAAHVSRCDKNGTIQILPGYWVGQILNIDDNTTQAKSKSISVSYWCPVTYCRCLDGLCTFDVRNKSSDSQCAHGRKGILCGQCKTNYSAVYGAIYPDCLPCSDEVTWIIPVLTIVALTIVVLAVLINFNAASKRVRSGVFYFQVVALTLSYIPPQGILSYRWIEYFAWIPNLSIRFNACLLDNMTTLQSTLFQYYIPGCIFVFMALGIMLARKFTRISRIHVLRPFWSMVTLTYVSVAYTTVLILNCVDIGDGLLRWFPDASVKCYEGNHLHAAIAASVIAAFYVVPLPFFLALAAPRIGKLKPICDIYLHDIKPSYWWAEGWYFFRRLLLIVFHCIFTDPNLRHTIIISSLSIFLALHAQLQPYAQPWNNHVETALILNLCLISAFQMYNSAGPVAPAATIVFFLLPYIAFLVYLVYYIIRLTKKRWLKGTHKTTRPSKSRDSVAVADEFDLSNGNSMRTDCKSVSLKSLVSTRDPRLSASLERGTSLDVMYDHHPVLREPLLNNH